MPFMTMAEALKKHPERGRRKVRHRAEVQARWQARRQRIVADYFQTGDYHQVAEKYGISYGYVGILVSDYRRWARAQQQKKAKPRRRAR